MKLTLELTGDQVASLLDNLRISTADMRVIAASDCDSDSDRQIQYARRILKVRHILDMDNNFKTACYDYESISRKEDGSDG